MIYTLEEMKGLISPMVASAVHDALEHKPISLVVDNVTNGIVEVIKQDREAHAKTTNKENLAANDD